MTGCIDRNTGKVTIIAEDAEKTKEVVRRLLNAARLLETKGRGADE